VSKPVSINEIIDHLIAVEGGFVNHPDDLGGPTNYGITAAVAVDAGWTGPISSLPEIVAREIYIAQYYSKPGFDRVFKQSQSIAVELVDTGVNMGVATAAKFLQRSLNALNKQGSVCADIKADGYIGNQTITALSAYLKYREDGGEQVMLKALNCLQGARYIEISEAREANESFTYGWLKERVL
jgi:lysozyme family protein